MVAAMIPNPPYFAPRRAQLRFNGAKEHFISSRRFRRPDPRNPAGIRRFPRATRIVGNVTCVALDGAA
jgi:hypothetical protein